MNDELGLSTDGLVAALAHLEAMGKPLPRVLVTRVLVTRVLVFGCGPRSGMTPVGLLAEDIPAPYLTLRGPRHPERSDVLRVIGNRKVSPLSVVGPLPPLTPPPLRRRPPSSC